MINISFKIILAESGMAVYEVCLCGREEEREK